MSVVKPPRENAASENVEAEDNHLQAQTAPKAPSADGLRDENGRYRKGRTGNANGRPKKIGKSWSHLQSQFDAVAEGNRLVKVVENGKVEFITARRLLIRQALVRGIKGDLKSGKAALDIIDRAQSAREWRDREVYKELEHLERQYDEMVGIGGEARAIEIMSEHYEKTKKR